MERLLFAKNVPLAKVPASINEIGKSCITEGAIALYDDTGAIITDVPTRRIPRFSIFIGGGPFANASDYYNSVLDIDTYRFEYAKTKYAEGKNLTVEITIPTPVKDKDYTITMVKLGTVLNERYKWSSSTRATEGDTAITVAKRLADELEALGKNEGFTATAATVTAATATAATAKITITAKDYQNWNVVAGDKLFGTTVKVISKAVAPVNDDAFLKELQLRCIGAEGINATERDAIQLYKLPVRSSATGWTTYALTFYNSRNLRSGNTENVKSIVYLAVPTDLELINTLDKIFAALSSVDNRPVTSEK